MQNLLSVAVTANEEFLIKTIGLKFKNGDACAENVIAAATAAGLGPLTF